MDSVQPVFSFQVLKGRIPDSIFSQLASIPQLTTAARISHLLGQCSHESAGFTRFTENLNYSTQGLLSTFPRYFTNVTAVQYARHPEMIANRVYANRMGNGDEASGTGWRHRGMGCIQVTGKKNQQAFFQSIGLPVDSDPTLIATTYPLVSAAWFFNSNRLWAICDEGVTVPVITSLTKRIQGASLGLQDRIDLTQHFYHLLTL